MELAFDHSQDESEGARRRERFAKERKDESFDGAREDDYPRVSPFSRTSRKRPPSTDDRHFKRRRSISPRAGGSYRPSRTESDRYIPSYGRDNYQSSRSRFTGRVGGQFSSGRPESPEMETSSTKTSLDPLDLNYLISPAQFAEYLMAEAKCKNPRGVFNLSQAEIERRYSIYRDNYMNRQQEAFFNMKKNSEWLRERYHPEEFKPLKEEINKRRLELFDIFISSLDSGKYDSISYDESVNIVLKPNNSQQTEEALPSDEIDSRDFIEQQVPDDNSIQSQDKLNTLDNQQKDHNTFDNQQKDHKSSTNVSNVNNKLVSYDLTLFKASDSSKNALFIRAVPPSIKRSAILEMCAKISGFRYLCLSDPKPEKDMHRLGWIILDLNTDMEEAYRAIDGKSIDNFTFHVHTHRDMEQRMRHITHDFNTKERLEKDLKQIRELAKVLEKEVGVLDNKGSKKIDDRIELIFKDIPSDPPSNEKTEDHQNSVDNEDDSVEVKKIKSTLDLFITYLRCVHQYDYYSSIECTSPEDFCRRSFVYFRRSVMDKLVKKGPTDQLDFKNMVRITKPDSGPDILKLGGRSLEHETDELLASHMKKEDGGKRRCKKCSKLFQSEQFIKKHFNLKHQSVIAPLEEEIRFFNNYVRDYQRAESLRYYLNAGGNIMNLGLRSRPQVRGGNMLLNGVVPAQLPSFFPMLPPNQVPPNPSVTAAAAMGNNLGISNPLQMFLLQLARYSQQNSVLPNHHYMDQFSRQQKMPLNDPSIRYPPPNNNTDMYHQRGNRARSDNRLNSRININYQDLDEVEYNGDLKLNYD